MDGADTAWICLGEYVGPACARSFIRYFTARSRKEREDMLFKTYVTDALNLIPQSKFLDIRWFDMTHPGKPISCDEVVDELVTMGGLVIK